MSYAKKLDAGKIDLLLEMTIRRMRDGASITWSDASDADWAVERAVQVVANELEWLRLSIRKLCTDDA